MAERDAKGRFKKGQSGNPSGRPPKPREERYHEIMKGTVSFKDFRQIIRKAVEQALLGDKDARRFLFEYILGRPIDQKQILMGMASAEEAEALARVQAAMGYEVIDA